MSSRDDWSWLTVSDELKLVPSSPTVDDKPLSPTTQFRPIRPSQDGFLLSSIRLISRDIQPIKSDYTAGVGYYIFFSPPLPFQSSLPSELSVRLEIFKRKKIQYTTIISIPPGTRLVNASIPDLTPRSISVSDPLPSLLEGCYIARSIILADPRIDGRRQGTLTVELDAQELGSHTLRIKPPRKGDIAYWYLVAGELPMPQPGQIISISTSHVSLDTRKGQLSVIPQPGGPWIELMKPNDKELLKRSVLTVYIGEVFVNVRSRPNIVDGCEYFVVPSGQHDGFGIVKAEHELSNDDPWIGRVVRQSDEGIHISEDGVYSIRILYNSNTSSLPPSGTITKNLEKDISELSHSLGQVELQSPPSHRRTVILPPPPPPTWSEEVKASLRRLVEKPKTSGLNVALSLAIANHDLEEAGKVILRTNPDLNVTRVRCPEARFSCSLYPLEYPPPISFSGEPQPSYVPVLDSMKPLCLAIALRYYEMIRLLFVYGAEFDSEYIICATHESPRAFLLNSTIPEETKQRIWNLIERGQDAARDELERERPKKPIWDKISLAFGSKNARPADDIEPILQILTNCKISSDLQSRFLKKFHPTLSTASTIRLPDLLSIGIPEIQAKQLFQELRTIVSPPVLFRVYQDDDIELLLAQSSTSQPTCSSSNQDPEM